MSQTKVVYIVVASTSGVQHFVTDLNIAGLTYDDDGYADVSNAENQDDASFYDLLVGSNNTALYGSNIPTSAQDPTLERLLAAGCVLSALGVITAETVHAFFTLPSSDDEMAKVMEFYEEEAVALAAKYADTVYAPESGVYEAPAVAEIFVFSVVTGF